MRCVVNVKYILDFKDLNMKEYIKRYKIYIIVNIIYDNILYIVGEINDILLIVRGVVVLIF